MDRQLAPPVGDQERLPKAGDTQGGSQGVSKKFSRKRSGCSKQEMGVWSLSQEDPVEKETATHSSMLALEIPWAEEPGGLQSMGSQRDRHDWATTQFQVVGAAKVKEERWVSVEINSLRLLVSKACRELQEVRLQMELRYQTRGLAWSWSTPRGETLSRARGV